MLRQYILRGWKIRQNVIGCVASGRPNQLISPGNYVPTPVRLIGGVARMVAGQSPSATKEGREKNGQGSYANNNAAKGRSSQKKSINLLRGWPSASLLPAAALCAASQTALTDPKIWTPGLEYGPDPGYQPLREALARWLRRFYRDVIPAASTDASGVGGGEGGESPRKRNLGTEKRRDENRNAKQNDADLITITGGASQSLACLLQSFTDPARTLAVWVVAPCYFLACPIFADAGFAGRLHAVPEDEEGVDMAVLEREICALEEDEDEETQQRHREAEDGDDDDSRGGGGPRRSYKDPGPHRKIYRHVIYCVPAFSNPSGRTMTLARREALVDLARRHDALVVCDDVYDMLQWRVASLPSSSSSPTSSSSPSLDAPPARDHDLHKALLPRVVDVDMARGRSPHDPPDRHFGHAVSNGSFSKLVAPGMRTGWTYSTADFAFGNSQTGSTRSGGAASQLAATIVCELLLLPPPPRGVKGGNDKRRERGDGDDNEEIGEKGEEEEECQLDTLIRNTLVPSYTRRHALLTRAIRTELVPLGARMHEGSLLGCEDVYGGYFVWITLPGGKPTSTSTPTPTATSTNTTTDTAEEETRTWPTAQAIADRCRADEALMIGNGELFAVHGDEDAVHFENAIRLCFAWEDEDDLVDGVVRLGRVIRKMLEEGPQSWQMKSRGLRDVDQAK
ncbi:pyridoxal phosphate-dependent transferase [Xylaria castorea]|nr:pyridoxal phosphate-dependent transferase [Xylaria castorea]